MLACNYMDTIANTFISAAKPIQLLRKNIFNNAAVRRIGLAMTTCIYRIVHWKKFSGISNLISDKIEYSKVVSQLLTLILQIIVAFMLQQGKQWTFKMKSPQFQLMISKTIMSWCFIRFQFRMLQEIFLTRTSCRITEAGAKLYFSSRARYWTQCIGRANIFGCSWQV